MPADFLSWRTILIRACIAWPWRHSGGATKKFLNSRRRFFDHFWGRFLSLFRTTFCFKNGFYLAEGGGGNTVCRHATLRTLKLSWYELFWTFASCNALASCHPALKLGPVNRAFPSNQVHKPPQSISGALPLLALPLTSPWREPPHQIEMRAKHSKNHEASWAP